MAEQRKEFRPNVIWDPEVESYLRDALGPARFEATAAALCRPPRTTCLRVNTLQTTPQDVLSRVRQMLGTEWPQDVVQIHPQVAVAVLLRGSGPHDVSYEAAVGKEVVVSRRAGEAVLRGAAVYAPGVLAVSSGVARGDLVALAVAGEKPGSDTPEITRGTTLYDTLPPAASCNGTVQPPPAGSRYAIAAIGTAHAASCCTTVHPYGSSAQAAAAAALTTTATGGGDNDDDGFSLDANGSTVAAALMDSTAPPPPLPIRHNGPSRRQRRQGQKSHGVTPHLPKQVPPPPGWPQQGTLGPDPASVGPPVPSAASTSGGGDLLGSSVAAAGGQEDDSAATQSEARAAAAAALGASCGSSGPIAMAPVLPPGWTASSQGPLAPRSGMYVGLARAAMSRQEMFRCREGLALELVEPVFRVPPAVAGLPTGWFMLQNLPSVVAALVLAPSPGCRLLDMCAAPGGKTTLLAAMMENTGEIIAFDRTHAKAAEVVALAKEMGATCVRAYKMDAGKALARPMGQQDAGHGSTGATACEDGAVGSAGNSEGTVAMVGTGITGLTEAGAAPPPAAVPAAPCGGGGGGRQPQSEKARLREERRRAAMIRRGITPPAVIDASGPPPGSFPPESFDHVLLDAPCSALGLRPRLQQPATATYLRQCTAAQRRLVEGAVRLLRVGGSLVYSTCTINPGENEAIVRYLLDKYGSSFRLVRAGPSFLGGPGLVGRHPTMVEAGVPLQDPPASSPITAITNHTILTTTTTATVEGRAADNDNGSGSGYRAQNESGEATTAVPLSGSGTAVTASTRGPGGLGLGTWAGAHRGVGPGGGEAWLTTEEAACVQRFDPADPDLDTIGFFVAKFVKTGHIAN